MVAAIALLDKIKNTKCHVSKKHKRNMHNFASTIKSKHEYKILPRSKPKVLQRKTELLRYVLWNFAVTEKTICCRELHNLSALYLYIVSEHDSTRHDSTELFKIFFSQLTLQLLFCKKLVGREKIIFIGSSKVCFYPPGYNELHDKAP